MPKTREMRLFALIFRFYLLLLKHSMVWLQHIEHCSALCLCLHALNLKSWNTTPLAFPQSRFKTEKGCAFAVSTSNSETASLLKFVLLPHWLRFNLLLKKLFPWTCISAVSILSVPCLFTPFYYIFYLCILPFKQTISSYYHYYYYY